MNCSPLQTKDVVVCVYLPVAELFAFAECAVCALCVREVNSVLDKYRRKPAEMFLSRGIWVLNHNTTSRVFAFTFFGWIIPAHAHTQAGYYRPPLTPRTACDPPLPSSHPLATHTHQRPGILHRAFKWIFKANPAHALIWAGFSPSGSAKPVSGEATGLQGSR